MLLNYVAAWNLLETFSKGSVKKIVREKLEFEYIEVRTPSGANVQMIRQWSTLNTHIVMITDTARDEIPVKFE